METQSQNNLSPKELYDLQKRGKLAQNPQRAKFSVWRWLIWVILVLVLLGGAAGIYWLVKTGVEPGGVVSRGDVLDIRSTDWQLGVPTSTSTAKATLVEYSDFACPACAVYSQVVSELKKDFGENLLVVYRHYPLYIHPNAKAAARSAESAGQQGAFEKMTEKLFAGQKDWEGLTDPQNIFSDYAEDLGLDKEKFLLDYNSAEVATKVEASLKEAQGLRLTYTPTFFLNGKLLENPGNYESFRLIIEKAINEKTATGK